MSELLNENNGTTYEPARDRQRLGKQAKVVFDLMADSQWRTLNRISALTGYPEASISARLRGYRACGWTVEREHLTNGLHRYRLVLPVPYQTQMHFMTERL